MATTEGSTTGPVTTWQGRDVSQFGDYLQASPYGKYIGNTWCTGPVSAALIDAVEAIDNETWGAQCVFGAFLTSIVLEDSHSTTYVIVAPQLACDIFAWDCSGDVVGVAGIDTVPTQWGVTPEQALSWLSAGCAVARTVDQGATIEDGVSVIEELRDRADTVGAKLEMACDAFAAIVAHAQLSGDTAMLGDDELLDGAVGAVL